LIQALLPAAPDKAGENVQTASRSIPGWPSTRFTPQPPSPAANTLLDLAEKKHSAEWIRTEKAQTLVRYRPKTFLQSTNISPYPNRRVLLIQSRIQPIFRHLRNAGKRTTVYCFQAKNTQK